MSIAGIKDDLVVLAADKNIEFTLRGLLSRPRSIGMREIKADIFVHPNRDPGCLLRSHDFLRAHVGRFSFALVVLDREGCGQEEHNREELERQIEVRLQGAGWRDAARAIVINPELETWVWTDSPHVAEVLGWPSQGKNLRTWLTDQGFLTAGAVKPSRPKEAVEATLAKTRRPRSSSQYQQLAARVRTEGCIDPAFQKLKATLIEWFPETGGVNP